MINTNKLLSNRSGGTTILSRKSVINIGLIRDDVKKVDNLLKMKLVMSKVREGIEKENQERLKRKKREDDLESEICNCDDDPDKRDIDPKKPRGLLGSLIGGVLSVLGGIALKFLPTLLKVFSFISDSSNCILNLLIRRIYIKMSSMSVCSISNLLTTNQSIKTYLIHPTKE